MRKAVVHFEIGCSNLAETADFYRDIFDWEIKENGNSAPIDSGREGAISGHITQLTPDEPQKYINIYIETDTLENDLEKIEAMGGKKMVGPITLPDGRRFAWFQDIAGNTVGLISPHKGT
ncbi:MAG: VOC family protein [Bacteroidota bacterium]